ncbi:MAG: hypothetical protein ACOYM2_13935 [Rectinemataceae bacterium]
MILKETVLYADGQEDGHTIYTWDAGLTQLKLKAAYDANVTEPIEKTTSEYRGGMLVAEVISDKYGQVRSRHELTWAETADGTAFVASEKTLDAKGGLQSASSYDYDAVGRKTLWKYFDSKNILKASTLYTYDTRGRLTLVTMKNAGDIVTGSISVEYSGDKEIRAYKDSLGTVQKKEVSILSADQLVRFEVRRTDGSLSEATDYTLGPLGERLTTVVSDGVGKVKEKKVSEYTVREDQKIEVYFE